MRRRALSHDILSNILLCVFTFTSANTFQLHRCGGDKAFEVSTTDTIPVEYLETFLAKRQYDSHNLSITGVELLWSGVKDENG